MAYKSSLLVNCRQGIMIAGDQLYVLDKNGILWSTCVGHLYQNLILNSNKSDINVEKMANGVRSIAVDGSSSDIFYIKDGYYQRASIYINNSLLRQSISGEANLSMSHICANSHVVAVVGYSELPSTEGRTYVDVIDRRHGTATFIRYNSDTIEKEFVSDAKMFMSSYASWIIVVHTHSFVDLLFSIDGKRFGFVTTVKLQLNRLNQAGYNRGMCLRLKIDDFTLVNGIGKNCDRVTLCVLAEQKIYTLIF